MPKVMYFMWVKNVNKLSIDGWVGGVLLSPVFINSVQLSRWFVGKLPLTHNYFPQQTTYLPTSFLVIFNLLNCFYTPSPQGLLLKQQKNI